MTEASEARQPTTPETVVLKIREHIKDDLFGLKLGTLREIQKEISIRATLTIRMANDKNPDAAAKREASQHLLVIIQDDIKRKSADPEYKKAYEENIELVEQLQDAWKHQPETLDFEVLLYTADDLQEITGK